MGKICIVPDVHGRSFWEEACLNHADEFNKIVFLGDYVAPYPWEGIGNERAIEVFRAVLDFKEKNPEKVVLLFGNHDWTYLNPDVCRSRIDRENWDLLNAMFRGNIKSFDLAWETEIDGKRYFFSHAGVRKGWFDEWVKDKLFKWDGDGLPPADYFNNLFHAAYDDGSKPGSESAAQDLETAIFVYSKYRGWGGEKAIQNPQRMVMAMAIELGELMEHFVWLDSTQLQALVAGNMPERRAHIAEELADVLIYAVQLARGLDIDVSDAMLQKIEIVKKRRDDPEYGRSHPHLD